MRNKQLVLDDRYNSGVCLFTFKSETKIDLDSVLNYFVSIGQDIDMDKDNVMFIEETEEITI